MRANEYSYAVRTAIFSPLSFIFLISGTVTLSAIIYLPSIAKACRLDIHHGDAELAEFGGFLCPPWFDGLTTPLRLAIRSQKLPKQKSPPDQTGRPSLWKHPARTSARRFLTMPSVSVQAIWIQAVYNAGSQDPCY